MNSFNEDQKIFSDENALKAGFDMRGSCGCVWDHASHGPFCPQHYEKGTKILTPEEYLNQLQPGKKHVPLKWSELLLLIIKVQWKRCLIRKVWIYIKRAWIYIKRAWKIPYESETDDIRKVSLSMECAKPYHLEAEVIWSAMNYLKTKPKASLGEALNYGIGEWIK